MKKTNSTYEASTLVGKGQGERLKSRGLKRDLEAFNSFACYSCRKPGRIKKNCMKYKEMLKKKCGKNSDGVSTSRKSEQTGVVEEADENPFDVLIA